MAAPAEAEKSAAAIEAELAAIEQSLQAPSLSHTALRELVKRIEVVQGDANACATAAEKKLKTIEQAIADVAKARPDAGAAPGARPGLEKEQAKWTEAATTCRLVARRADEVRGTIAKHEQALVERKLFVSGDWIGKVLWERGRDLPAWSHLARSIFTQEVTADITTLNRLVGGLAVTLAFAVGFGIVGRRRLARWQAERTWDAHLPGRFGRALTATFAFYLPYLAFAAVLAAFVVFLVPAGEQVTGGRLAVELLPVYLVSLIVLHTVLSPRFHAPPMIELPEKIRRLVARLLKTFLLVGFLGYVLHVIFSAPEIPQATRLILRAAVAVLLFASLARTVWLLRVLKIRRRVRWPAYLFIWTLAAALVAELAGYRNLAAYLTIGVIGSALAFGALLFVHVATREVLFGLQQEWRPWHQHVRRWFGLRPGERTSLLPWLYALTVIFIWVAFVFGLLEIWRFPEATVVQVRRYLLDGFKVGSVDVVPVRIYGSVAVFAALFALSAWVRGRLENRWLIDSTMDRGAREAIVSITGYTGIILSVIVALSVAGVGFGNLALIAGALSVGIGFGLQNIVNNFVSGLILLFERPIKTGDWIVVGNTEGYVRSIRIRSTQIQTFDRADVIVPNSELISGQVTNWMLRDPRGRVRIPIGVAYGSDTQKVREVLLEVARAHPEIINDDSVPGPRVLFREFGDSSLNFELRVFIRNIDSRLNVISDLNFAIDAGFRAHGIEVPFPQRDVHIRDIKGLAEALREK